MPSPLGSESQLSGKWANGIPGLQVFGLSHGSSQGAGHGPLRSKVPLATPSQRPQGLPTLSTPAVATPGRDTPNALFTWMVNDKAMP